MTSGIVERITETYARDQERNAVAVSETDLPLSYESIPAEWLTRVLCKSAPGPRSRTSP